jgi:hypothetical protein
MLRAGVDISRAWLAHQPPPPRDNPPPT